MENITLDDLLLIINKKTSTGNKIIIGIFLFIISTIINFVPSVFTTLSLKIRFPMLVLSNTKSLISRNTKNKIRYIVIENGVILNFPNVKAQIKAEDKKQII